MPDYKSIYSGEQIDLAVGKVLTPDAAPTTNSQNLVTSGGVKAAIDNATAEFGGIETRVESIEGKIPSGASSSNKLATASDVAAKYTKPSGGIPKTDLASAVQTSLGKADSAYQKPVAGIPKTDLASDVQLSLQKADEAAPQSTTYTKTEVDEQMKGKAGKNDYAPALVAGSAGGLLGVSKAQEFTFAAVPEGTGNGAARIGKVKGNSLAWNQLFDGGTLTRTLAGVPMTFTNGHVVGSGTANVASNVTLLPDNKVKELVLGHKYYVHYSGAHSGCELKFYAGASYPMTDLSQSVIITANGVGSANFVLKPNEVGGAVSIDCYLFFLDLTLMFGAGKEPSTVAEFEALYHELYYPQNNGEIINNAADTLVTDGFNQWDEVVEIGAIYSSNGSNNNGVTDQIRSKNYSPCFGGVVYYFRNPTQVGMPIFWYAIDKSYLGYNSISGGGGTVTSPTNAAYFRIMFQSSYGTTYKNDLCINRSDPARNGQYEPYWRRTLPLAITSLRGRPNGAGERVAIFPDGMKRAGDAYDEVYGNIAIKRAGSVDMGTLSWIKYEKPDSTVYFRAGVPGKRAVSGTGESNLVCARYSTITRQTYNSIIDKSIMEPSSNTAQQNIAARDDAYTDAATFKTAMNGVMLNYELATPEIYILDEPIPSGFAVGAGGTMHALPDAIDGTPTAPFAAEIAFPRDNYGITSKNSTVALLEALKTAGKIASYTIGYDANGDMTFNIT